MAAIRLEEEFGRLPGISPVRKPEKDSEEEEVEEVVMSNQVVLNITMRDWNVFGKIKFVFLSKL